MKRSLLFAALVIATASFGDTFRTNDVEGLVYLLKTYNGTGHTIELESGDYNLTEECSWYTNSSAYASHLYLTKTCLKGVGDSRESVKLIGDGSLRIIYGDAGSTVANLMITNGYAAVVAGYSNSGRGGGVSGGLAVTNCLITGNIVSFIYVDDHYTYTVRTKSEEDYVVHDADLWNQEDFVSLIIPEDKVTFRVVRS